MKITTDLLAAMERGATLLTVNRRLAAYLLDSFAQQQLAQQRMVWPTPQVLPLAAWQKQVWQELVYQGKVTAVLLSDHQRQAVWERIILESEAGGGVLNAAATARSAIQAWQLLQQWQIPFERLPADHNPDLAAFKDWAETYRRQCRQRNWIDGAVLPSHIIAGQNSLQPSLPLEMVWVGFDEITPQQQSLIDALTAAGHTIAIETMPAGEGKAQLRPCADVDAEIRAMTIWARDLLQSNDAPRIAVVVPDLARLRPQIERQLDDVLMPAVVLDFATVPTRPYNISLAEPLAEVPVIAVALQILQLLRGEMELSRFGRLMLSPFIKGSEQEFNQRARFDARLRRHGEIAVTISGLRRWLADRDERASPCPLLLQALTALSELIEVKANRQPAADWADFFNAVLQAMGWPGERSLNSHEYQAVQAWKDLLRRFTSLGAVLPAMDSSDAGRQLRQLAATTLFQPQSGAAPIQVLGVLEAAGMQFDHLWLMGVHDEVWPPPPQPNPFLPITLQRKEAMPHASAERELHFTQQLTQRLLNAAAQVVVSYPCLDGDRELRPSPLIADLPLATVNPEAETVTDFRQQIHNSARLESISDWQGSSLPANSHVGGGAGIFRDQAACPFRAFARYRLSARSLDEPVSGLNAAERGNLVHRVLESAWQGLNDQQTLCQKSSAQLSSFANDVVTTVINEEARRYPQVFTTRFAGLESQRLQKLLLDWLTIEKQRQSFTVLATEQQRRISLAGLEVDIKADRIDRFANGNEMIIDYKTGKPSVADWFSVRPDEPQLPLYAVTHEQPVTALAFAQVNIEKSQFYGLSATDGVADGITPFSKSKYNIGKPSWHSLLDEWRQVLEKLATQFRAGDAAVDPKEGAKTCQYCDIAPLCRINELASLKGGDDD